MSKNTPCKKKDWKNFYITVNSLEVQTSFCTETIEKLFLPFLRRLTELRRRTGRRIVVFLAAPPAAGKSTLTLFLEQLSRETEGVCEVQGIGLDGFHFHADYIAGHSVVRDGVRIPMKTVKGAPETYDIGKLAHALKALRTEDILWPVYSRTLHDVIEDAVQVDGNIVIVEGNWLLLDEPDWREIAAACDYSVMIKANEDLLRDRLIARKVRGGLTAQAAEAFYETSDRLNIIRVLTNSRPTDETWQLLPDNDYMMIRDESFFSHYREL